MKHHPVLVLQMQRMGDLVLSFPLLADLGRGFPGHEIWVVGEADFFKPLMPLSPPAVYFSYAESGRLEREKFHLVINISHRPEAAALAGKLKSDRSLGPRLDDSGRLFIDGDWQLYRASLTHNNRYNLYHWADLNRLDLFSGGLGVRRIQEGSSRIRPGARVGLFVGASEAEKRPDADFWVGLCVLLLRGGYKPVLLGGEAEKELGVAVAAAVNAGALNLTGRFTLSELARFMSGLDFFISPDTGPMHVAAWIGLPLLNLSLGPVNPWETGPFVPNRYIVEADLDCRGCWRCVKKRVLCREELSVEKVFALLRHIFTRPGQASLALQEKMQGLRLWRSGYEESGLYDLQLLFPNKTQGTGRVNPSSSSSEFPGSTAVNAELARGYPDPARYPIAHFWRKWFGEIFGRESRETVRQSHAALRRASPEAAVALASAAAAFALELARNYRSNPENIFTLQDLWRKFPPIFRPFSGYAHMYLQNSRGAREAFLRVLRLTEELAEE
ncbi:MAG: glycosyltransferase family 9 protein [Desulfovibrio sp.]|jgi:ADP-heptose:LPS heptosyltransferase|nr:glycosyltransferase family 9 protein [Desulfovibrio sp.]